MRLTNEIRKETQTKVIDELIAPKITKIKKVLADIAQDIADNMYPKKTREWMAAAPKGGLSVMGNIHIKYGEGDSEKIFSHDLLKDLKGRWGRVTFSLKKPVKVLAIDRHNDAIKAPKKYGARLVKITQELDSIEAEKEELVSTLRSALFACNTKAQLQEHYPDLVKYLPTPKPVAKALAVTNKDVVKVIKKVAA